MKSYLKYCMAALLPLLFAGCGDSGDVKDPPVEGLQLIDRMFSSMEKKNFAVAGTQYRKLIDGKAEQLDQVSLLMEQTIATNDAVANVQRALDANDLYGAIQKAKDAKRIAPLNREIDIMLVELEFLDNLARAAAGVRHADNSAQLESALHDLNLLIRTNPKAAGLKRLSEVGADKLEQMRSREELRGKFDLLADLYRADVTADRLLPTLRAEYEYELTKSPMNRLPTGAVQDELYKRSR